EDGTLGMAAAQSLVRAQGHSADRLALWQVEALVEDAVQRYALDDTSARLLVLDRVARLAPVLEQQLVHTWRRQLVALLGRIDRDVALAHAPPVPDADQLPLERAIGFLDMISFTERSARMSPGELAELVQGFESAARDTIAGYGARVVKTIGDAVLYVADDLRTGAEVSLALLDAMGTRGFEVRGSLVWGRVLSRAGEVFGPSVTLASRLGGVAPPGAVVRGDGSAALLEARGLAVRVTAQGPVAVRGPGVAGVGAGALAVRRRLRPERQPRVAPRRRRAARRGGARRRQRGAAGGPRPGGAAHARAPGRGAGARRDPAGAARARCPTRRRSHRPDDACAGVPWH